MNTLKLSVLITAHNEQAQLADCLQSVAFADEIVVLLDNCSDDSKSIAEQFNASIIEGHWLIEGERRNDGLAACTGDWILELDADERVTAKLAEEIQQALPKAAFGYFKIPFDNYVGKRLVKYGWGCSWGINSKKCLFAKGAKYWDKQRVHPKITLSGKAQQLQQSIIHYSFADISDMINRFNAYTTRRAEDLVDVLARESYAHNIRRIFTRFLKCYVQRKGYREGFFGVLNGIFAGLFPIISYFKYLEKQKQQKNTYETHADHG